MTQATPALPTSQHLGDLTQLPPGYPGAQRLPLSKLQAWESLDYGMFICFGMSTFTGSEYPDGTSPARMYAPDQLDVDQWVQVARDAGMRYAVLTAKHVAGHCLWPSDHTDYHVGNSSEPTDVVEAFFKACDKYGIAPGLYYSSWDNHHLFGSRTMSQVNPPFPPYTTRAYRDFQLAQVEELLTRYGPIAEMWIDIPYVLGHDGRVEQYEQVARLAPDALIMMNTGFGNGMDIKVEQTWPTDLVAIERELPPSNGGHQRWRQLVLDKQLMYRGPSDFLTVPCEPQWFYLPAEVCEPVGREWFWTAEDQLRSHEELLGMRLLCQARHANLLLSVPPDQTGRIPPSTVEALTRLATRA